MSLEGGGPRSDQADGPEKKTARSLSARASGTEEYRRTGHFCRDPRIVTGSFFMCCGWFTLLLVFVVLVSLLVHFQSVSLQQTLRMSAHDSKLVTEVAARLCPRLRFDNPSQGIAALFVLSEAPEALNRYSFSFNEPSRLSPQSPNSDYFAHLSPRANVTFNVCKDDEDAFWGPNAALATLRLYAFNSYASYQDWLMHGRSTYVDSVEVDNLCSEGQPMIYHHSATNDNDWYYVFRLDEVSLTIVFKPGMSLERINYGVMLDHQLDLCVASGLLGATNCTVMTAPGAQYLILTGDDFDLALATEMQATCIGADEAYLPATVVSSVTISLIAVVAFIGGICLWTYYCYKDRLSNCSAAHVFGHTLPSCFKSSQVNASRGHHHNDYYDAEHLISQEHHEETDLLEPSAGLTTEVLQD